MMTMLTLKAMRIMEMNRMVVKSGVVKTQKVTLIIQRYRRIQMMGQLIFKVLQQRFRHLKGIYLIKI
jgi:hypothetical protein